MSPKRLPGQHYSMTDEEKPSHSRKTTNVYSKFKKVWEKSSYSSKDFGRKRRQMADFDDDSSDDDQKCSDPESNTNREPLPKIASLTIATKRIMQDYKELCSQVLDGISVKPSDDDVFLWKVSMIGPEGSPFEERAYDAILLFSQNHPFYPPELIFTTPPVFHPNVFPAGKVCLEGLEEKWKPCYPAWLLLVSVQILLGEPSPNQPANDEAAKLFLKDFDEYSRVIREG